MKITILSLHHIFKYFTIMSKEMNKNFRVKFNRLLVGYSGLCSRIGVERANVLISCMLRTSVQSKKFKVKGNVITFYCK